VTSPGRPAGAPEGAPEGAPRPLQLAAWLVVLEGLVLVGYGIAVLTSLSLDKAAMGATTSVFFVVYGVGLVLFARLLRLLRTWSRAPVVLAQLIQLGVAWNFRGGATTAAAVVLAVVAVAVLAGIFHPASMAALDHAEDGAG
jgi:uncharacterized membrane protein HdeD (DUF308 family)